MHERSMIPLSMRLVCESTIEVQRGLFWPEDGSTHFRPSDLGRHSHMAPAELTPSEHALGLDREVASAGHIRRSCSRLVRDVFLGVDVLVLVGDVALRLLGTCGSSVRAVRADEGV